MRFVDTNVLLYAVCAGPEDGPKHERAVTLLRNRDLALSVQVLQEFYWQATHARRVSRLSHDEARAHIRDFGRFPVYSVTPETLELALALTQRFQIAYWDAAILAAARLGGCDTLLTEDLSAGQDYEGIHVVNPFAGVGESR